MNYRYRITLIIVSTIMILLMAASCSRGNEQLFSTVILNDQEVKITKYHGKSTNIVVPDSINGRIVTAVDSKVFWGNQELKTVKLPETVRSIANNAFYSCASLTELNIPRDLEELGENVFNGCSSLKKITVSNGNEHFSAQDGVLFSKDKSLLILYPISKSGQSYTIPQAVTHIGRGAFEKCTTLQDVVFPEGLIEVGLSAFKGCTSLKEAALPEGLKSLRASSFWECESLYSVTMPESIDRIGEFIFHGCASLRKIYVKENSFAHEWCIENNRAAVVEFY